MKKQIIFDEINRPECKELTHRTLKKLGEKLKELRIEGKLSQLDMSFYTYSEKSFISNLENGKIRNTTLLTLVKLAQLFEVTVEDLLKDD